LVLRLAAEGKAAKTIRTYTEAVQWFAAADLPRRVGRDGWEQVTSRDIQRWMAWLLDRSGNREPLTAAGIYQMITRCGRQAGVDAFPHRFRHHFSHSWPDRAGPEGDLMDLNGWASPQMLRATAPASAPAAPTTAS
jgi:hypothetical protein